MSLDVLTHGGGGGKSASIFVTGLDQNTEVKATHKELPPPILNPDYVVPDGYT
jgi:hypothetical protein